MEMNAVDKVSWILIVVGGLNWGLVGFFKYNLVEKIFSNGLSRAIYDVVGVAAVYSLWRMVTMMASMSKADKK